MHCAAIMSQRNSTNLTVDVLCDLDDYLASLAEEPEEEVEDDVFEPSPDAEDACPSCRVNSSPLICAATSGHSGCLKVILSKGNCDLASERSENGATLAHILARKNEIECLRIVIAADYSLCTVGDARGATPLHVCAHHGHADCLVCLIDNGGSANQKDFDGATPVHFAAASGHLNCLKMLLERGKGDPNPQTKSGETPGTQSFAVCLKWCTL